MVEREKPISEDIQKLTSFEQLEELTKDGSGIVDPFTMMTFRMLISRGQDVESIALPMLARVRVEDMEEISENATVLTAIGDIVGLTATPSQLLKLVQMSGVISLEASRPSGGWD